MYRHKICQFSSSTSQLDTVTAHSRRNQEKHNANTVDTYASAPGALTAMTQVLQQSPAMGEQSNVDIQRQL